MSGQKIIDGLKDVLQSIRQDYVTALQNVDLASKIEEASILDTHPARMERQVKRQRIKSRIDQIDAALSDD